MIDLQEESVILLCGLCTGWATTFVGHTVGWMTGVVRVAFARFW